MKIRPISEISQIAPKFLVARSESSTRESEDIAGVTPYVIARALQQFVTQECSDFVWSSDRENAPQTRSHRHARSIACEFR